MLSSWPYGPNDPDQQDRVADAHLVAALSTVSRAAGAANLKTVPKLGGTGCSGFRSCCAADEVDGDPKGMPQARSKMPSARPRQRQSPQCFSLAREQPPPPRFTSWRTCEADGLPKFRPLWDAPAINLRRLLNLAFAVFVTAGLALAPMAAPAAAARARSGSMTDMSMSADMPCCPDEQKSKDCQDCPLIAMCILKTAQAAPSTATALPLRHPVRTTHSFRDDVLVDGLDRPPPDHPPRNLA